MLPEQTWEALNCSFHLDPVLVMTVQTQCQQRNPVSLQNSLGFNLLHPRSHHTNLIPFLQGFVPSPFLPFNMEPWISILKQAQDAHSPDWKSFSELVSSDTQKLSSNLHYKFIHGQHVAVWSWTNIILQIKKFFPFLSIYHLTYLLGDATAPLTFVQPG